MSEAPHTWLQAVAEVAKLAGDAALRHYPSPPAVELKSDGSPVTVADRDAEGKARAFIEEFFPGDGILGEEFGVSRPDAPRRWLIDPIDGTASFIRGVPLWGSLVAVVEVERVVAGAAYFPVIGDILTASPGHGCFRNGYACSSPGPRPSPPTSASRGTRSGAPAGPGSPAASRWRGHGETASGT